MQQSSDICPSWGNGWNETRIYIGDEWNQSRNQATQGWCWGVVGLYQGIGFFLGFNSNYLA